MGLLPDTLTWGLCMRCECPERFPRNQLQRKPLVSDHGMHHSTRVTHMQWCMPGSLTRCGKKVAGIPGACATRNFTYLATDPLCGECSCLWGTDMLRTIMWPTPNADPVWIILGVVVLLTGTPWLTPEGDVLMYIVTEVWFVFTLTAALTNSSSRQREKYQYMWVHIMGSKSDLYLT